MKPLTITYPKANDVRWPLLAIQLGLVAYSLHSPAFTRTLSQYLVTLATCLCVDVAFLIYKRLPLFPLSAIIHATAILLLCDSRVTWVYAVVAAISVISKHVIRIRSRHIFVPNVFGLVVGVLFLGDYMTLSQARWSSSWVAPAIITGLGVFIAVRARRIILVLAYMATFLLGVLVRSELTHAPLLMVVAPFTGAAFQLFSYFIITDPVVTPRPLRQQAAFGIALGIVDGILRFSYERFAPFFALIIVAAGYSFLEEALGFEPDQPWSLGRAEIALGRVERR